MPLKIINDEAEHVDSPSLDVNGMIADLKKYKGTSRSSCPNAEEWTNAFGDADGIFCITITSGLSGSYNSALLALNEHLEAHPEKKGEVHIHHCQNPEGADYLVANIKAKFPEAKIVLRQTRALCSFYAKSGGILVGFEGKSK